MAAKTTEHSTKKDDEQQPTQQPNTNQHCVYKKTVYSEPECILGRWHRVRLEAQLLSRSLLSSQVEGGLNSGSGSGGGSGGSNEDKNHGQHILDEGQDDTVLVCRFELQRDRSATNLIPSQHQQHVGDSPNAAASHKNTSQRPPSKLDGHHHGSGVTPQQTKIRYDIYCLNRHQVLDAIDHMDPEDKVPVPVSKVTEANDAIERSSSYVKQVVLNVDALDTNDKIDVDIVVALEIFGFQKM